MVLGLSLELRPHADGRWSVCQRGTDRVLFTGTQNQAAAWLARN